MKVRIRITDYRHAASPEIVGLFLSDFGVRDPAAWVTRDCAFDKCSSRDECYWRSPFAGESWRYCRAPHHCEHRIENARPSIRLQFPDDSERRVVKFSHDRKTRSVLAVYTEALRSARDEGGIVGAVATARSTGDWVPVRQHVITTTPIKADPSTEAYAAEVNERVMDAQKRLRDYIAAYADAHFHERRGK